MELIKLLIFQTYNLQILTCVQSSVPAIQEILGCITTLAVLDDVESRKKVLFYRNFSFLFSKRVSFWHAGNFAVAMKNQPSYRL